MIVLAGVSSIDVSGVQGFLGFRVLGFRVSRCLGVLASGFLRFRLLTSRAAGGLGVLGFGFRVLGV